MFLASGEFNYRRVQNVFEGIAFAIDICAVPLRPFPFAFPFLFLTTQISDLRLTL
jgi:hypothetical protein